MTPTINIHGQLTKEQAKKLEIETISSKYLTSDIKMPVYYDTIQEAIEDTERYGSVWLTTEGNRGFYQIIDDDGKVL